MSAVRMAKARRVPGRMNKTEAEYEKLFLGNVPHGFEEITLRLGDDCRYTPDFWVLDLDDVLAFVEVKGFWRDDAKVKLRVAAERFPQFRFRAVSHKAGLWQIEVFNRPDVAVA